MKVERVGAHIRLFATGPVDVVIRPPGSKSLTNRYLACLALADGTSRLRFAGICDDTERMIAGLQSLGVQVSLDADACEIVIKGCRGNFPAEEADIDIGAAGTAMRFMTALVALGQGQYRLDGTERMRERPIRLLVDALTDLGAFIQYELETGYPPISVNAHGLTGGTILFSEPPSSQYISALLMVAPYALQDVKLGIKGAIPSRPYVDMTLDVMRALGVETVEANGRFVIPTPQRYMAADVDVEPDASGATYFWGAAAMTGGRARVDGLTRASRQGDARFVDVLEKMGCTVTEGENFLEVQGPPVGKLKAIDIDLNDMPDTAQTLAVIALAANGTTVIRNVENLRIKETDRIAALAAELSKLGARVSTSEDGLSVTPPKAMKSAEIDTYDDHRMAMCFALAGLLVDGIVIKNADCVSKSFPKYFDVWADLASSRP